MTSSPGLAGGKGAWKAYLRLHRVHRGLSFFFHSKEGEVFVNLYGANRQQRLDLSINLDSQACCFYGAKGVNYWSEVLLEGAIEWEWGPSDDANGNSSSCSPWIFNFRTLQTPYMWWMSPSSEAASIHKDYIGIFIWAKARQAAHLWHENIVDHKQRGGLHRRIQ